MTDSGWCSKLRGSTHCRPVLRRARHIPLPSRFDMSIRSGKTLGQHVADSLRKYFENLDGQDPPQDLYAMVLQQVEPPLLTEVLRHCNGNQSRAAQMLGINRATLRKKLRAYAIDPDQA